MFVLSINTWFQTLMRQFFFNIDKIVFNFISTLYEFLTTIARTSILSQSDIQLITNRIYQLLAVFMVFKVTFSLIMYVVNPDDFSDKSKGVGKLGLNIMISLGVLILTPYIFSYAYRFQTIILEDNSLATLIMGDTDEDKDAFNTAGDKMAYMTLAPFFTPNVSIDNLYECVELTVKTTTATGTVVKFNPACSGLNDNYEPTDDSDSLQSLVNDERFTMEDLKTYVAGVENSNLGLMFRQDMATAMDENKKNYIIDYKYLFSTAIGIIVILILISFCLDVAVRSIKLAFLQLVAPIPIISYVDPKSGKDGLFKKWYQMCFKTYLSLFIRLLALYFAVFIISKIDRMVDIVDGSYVTNLFVKIFIIIGALMFAKQLPKILEGLGIKLDGGFQLNPLKKIENEALGGKQIAKAARVPLKYAGRGAKGLVAGGLAGAAAFGTNLIARRGNVFSATAGALSATARGLKGAVKGEKFGKNFSNSYGGAMKARTNRADRKDLGINAFDVASENIKKRLYIPNEAQKNKLTLDHLNEYTSAGKTAKTRAEGEVDKKASMIEIDGQNLGALRDSYEILKNTQIKRRTGESDAAYQARVEQHARLAAEANAKYFKARKKAVNAYVNSADNLSRSSISIGGSTITGFDSAFSGDAARDEIVASNVEKMKQLNSDYSMQQPVNSEDIGATIQNAENETARIQGSREYRQAELISQQAQKEKSSK